MSLKVVMKAQETFQQDESAKVETYWKIVNGNTLESHDKQHTFVYGKFYKIQWSLELKFNKN